MSTYLRTTRTQLHSYEDNIPLLWEFLRFSVEETKRLSLRSSNIYYVNIRLFLRYLKALRRSLSLSEYDKLSISDITEEELLSINSEDIKKYLAFRTSLGDSPLSLRQKLVCLKAFFAYLIDRKLLEKNPTTEVDWPAPKRQTSLTLSPDEIDLLLRTAADRNEGIRDYCITALLTFSGLNLSELCQMNLSDVSETEDTGEITVLRHGESTRLSVNKICRESLRDWLKHRSELHFSPEEKALFPSPLTRHRITTRQVQKIIDDCIFRSGLSEKDYNTTSLRRTAAMIQRENGKNASEIGKSLGHINEWSTKQMLKALAPIAVSTEKEASL